MMSKEKRRVPKLRFPGFTEDWEQRKLSDISTKVTTKNVDVHYTETLTNSAEQGIISQVDFFDKEISNKDNINGYYIVDNNDFIYNPRISTLAPVGPINRNKLNRTGIMSPLYTVFRSSNVDLGFLEWYFQSSHWHRYMKLNGDSGARADRIAIKDSTFFEMPIKIPVNIKEQVLIGEILEKFNQYITLHQRKLDNLKLKKKALLQKLFPKNGERYPELRFPGFTDTWEQRKFSDLYEKISEKNDLSYSLDKIISVANMYYKSDAKVSNEEYLRTYNIFRYGEIAFEGNKSKNFAYGRFVENTIGDGIISHVFEVFRPIVKYDIYFWKYYINYEPIMGKVLSRCTKKTTMMTNLVAKDFLKETILVPTLAEQKQIGTLLNTLDKFITLHQRKLDHLKLQKKALLQQMFV
ncbi:restriction endonuclease subunit S [Veillonella rogosae]|uniref:restriction endonuclease subunit S n=1 Tax=Veillonella rogosae TaxID=423477 RepID=UPI002365397B|nr:restriction endonuclease subunit S [Veillonella rogosae]